MEPLGRFHDTLDGLRDLHADVMPHVADLDEKRLSPEALTVLRQLPAEKRERLRKAMRRILDRQTAAESEPVGPGGNNGASAHEAEVEQGLDEDDERELVEIFEGHDNARLEFSVRLGRALRSPARTELLRSSLLTMAVAAFEVLCGRIVAAKFGRHPKSLGSEPEFSLAQLEAFSDISEARELLIENRVDSFARRDFDSWADWFKKDANLGLDFDSLCIDRAALSEIFQRRHVIVHNSGQASRRYLQYLELDNPPKVGQSLPVSEEYLDAAIDQLDALGTLLAIGAWAKLYSEGSELAYAFMSERSQQLMYIGRWNPVKCICGIGIKLDGKTAKQRCEVFKVNHWLAIKRLDGLDRIKGEINEWDTSALDPVFPFVKSVLLDELDEAFDQLPSLFKGDSLNQASLEQWPILEEMRADPRCEDFLKKADGGA